MPDSVSAPPADPRPGRWAAGDAALLAADGGTCEVVDGSLHVTPRAGVAHHELADEVRAALRLAAPPGWRAVRDVGVAVPAGTVVADVAVLRPGAPADARWADPRDVALVVEVESASSRRHDRLTKPGLYAEAGIDCFWRVEVTGAGAVAHLYQQAAAGHYSLHRSVHPGQVVTAELPFAVQVAPALWHAAA